MIGWLDAQAGVSGDMLLGALVDAGVPLEVLNAPSAALGVTLTATTVERGGIGATKVDVHAPDDASHRSWRDLQSLVSGRAHDVFARLAAAEAAIHRVAVDDVHFHEVGGHDAVADIAGVCAGLDHLGLAALSCSTVTLGSGTTRGAHGPLPVPAPAVLALLQGAPVAAGPVALEMTTPTGAALLAELVTDWGPLPPMTVTTTGYGAGGRDPQEVANVLRLVLGEPLGGSATAVLLETNVDDLDPRVWPHVLQQLLAAGASDAWLTPILMKKGRPAHTLSVLVTTARAADVRRVVFAETSTIGLRESTVGKHALDRTESVVSLEGQQIRVKTAWLDGAPVNTQPEWDDVQAAALALGRPAVDVLAAATALARGT